MARNNRNQNNNQGKMSREEAGRLGGETHGPQFYENIGSDGADQSPSRFDREGDPEAAGREGGKRSHDNQYTTDD